MDLSPSHQRGSLMSLECTPPSPTEVTLCFVYLSECILPRLPSVLPPVSAGSGTVHRKSSVSGRVWVVLWDRCHRFSCPLLLVHCLKSRSVRPLQWKPTQRCPLLARFVPIGSGFPCKHRELFTLSQQKHNSWSIV